MTLVIAMMIISKMTTVTNTLAPVPVRDKEAGTVGAGRGNVTGGGWLSTGAGGAGDGTRG